MEVLSHRGDELLRLAAATVSDSQPAITCEIPQRPSAMPFIFLLIAAAAFLACQLAPIAPRATPVRVNNPVTIACQSASDIDDPLLDVARQPNNEFYSEAQQAT